MKTAAQIREEIDRLMKVGANTGDRSEKKRIRERLQFLRPISIYMESNPTQSSIESQLNECIKRMDVIHRDFDHRYPSYCDTRTKSEFMKGKGLPELKKQVKVLQYILESK
jgi:hypothetical protein